MSVYIFWECDFILAMVIGLSVCKLIHSVLLHNI